ncbi:hypothetical protein ACQR1I_27320 [Bradyrhizobium sp. HKCCYLS2038]
MASQDGDPSCPFRMLEIPKMFDQAAELLDIMGDYPFRSRAESI